MRRCAQDSQRLTCPPNAPTGRARGLKAHVRQRSIADMTLSWPRLTWPAWEARQAGPRWRKMSATSTAGRDNGRASAGHLQQKIERAGHLAERGDGDAGVKRRRVELFVSERTRAIMRTFYVIEIGSSPERNSMLANGATASACDTRPGPPP